MTPELEYLVWGTMLLLVHIVVQATFSDLCKGLGWALGPQDEKREQSQIAARIERALANFLQTYAGFAALALILSVTELGTTTSALGAALWFWARLIYIPAYASGVPIVRSIAWFASIGGLIMMLLPLL